VSSKDCCRRHAAVLSIRRTFESSAHEGAPFDRFSDSLHTLRVTILLVCADEHQRNRLKEAIHSGGFHTISARGIDDAWARTDFFDVGAVVIDHELRIRPDAGPTRPSVVDPSNPTLFAELQDEYHFLQRLLD
jgi:hypothetical protein